MKKNLMISVLFTLVTTVIFGLIYPLVVTGLAQVLFPGKANGQLIEKDGKIVGSRIIGQAFTARVFPFAPFGRRHAAMIPWPAADRIMRRPTRRCWIALMATCRNCMPRILRLPVPVDLVTTSASGLIPRSLLLRRTSRFRAWRANGR